MGIIYAIILGFRVEGLGSLFCACGKGASASSASIGGHDVYHIIPKPSKGGCAAQLHYFREIKRNTIPTRSHEDMFPFPAQTEKELQQSPMS